MRHRSYQQAKRGCSQQPFPFLPSAFPSHLFGSKRNVLGSPRNPPLSLEYVGGGERKAFVSNTQTSKKVTGLSRSFLCDARVCCARAQQRVSQTQPQPCNPGSTVPFLQFSTPDLSSGSLTFDEGRSKINRERGGQPMPSSPCGK